ncbi:tetratricopeptide repeat protein [Methanogenium organophilum]|uniref:Tetratricopeptide repeat protein n=1 Tax=Methanogenium organophilum TaxID=2199 RepID=A0A9X9S3V2_METOG|nr:tetratricopeptide repeat protein [Methanogenium organophilum]WAI01003.1 tetratricopeptide repeat protein [Methanogenium organophilum]
MKRNGSSGNLIRPEQGDGSACGKKERGKNMKAIWYLFTIGVILAAIALSAGCTDYMPSPVGGYMITDNNVTHQKWMSEYLEDPEKFKTNPENPLEWTLKGMSSVAAGGRHEEALEYYDIAIGLDPEYAFPYYEKAFSLLILQRYDEGEECLEKAVEINPQYEPLAKRIRSDFIRKES